VLAQARAPLGGRATLDISLGGTRIAPRYQLAGELTNATTGDVAIERLRVGGRYADRELTSTLELFRRGRPVLSAEVALPLDLALAPVEHRLLDAPLHGTIRTDSVELGILETFTTAVRNASGRIDTDVDLGGTWERPTLTGRLGIAGGALDLPALGVSFERLDADVGLVGDSIHVHRFTVLSRHENVEQGDTASLTGFAKFADLENPQLGLTLFARDFRLINRRGVGRLDVSTPAPGLQLDGGLDDARLTGSLVLERGQIEIPELVQRRPIDLSDPELLQQLDTTLLETRRYLPSGPNRFVQGLQLQGVRLIVGDEVWLRSSEANIKLGGEVAVTKGRTAQNERARLGLEGTLNAVRGTYTLDLGLVQRSFEVDTGRVVFYGDARINPALDISALHTVRQVNRQDVRIRVHIGGTLDRPELTLSSAEGLPISQPVLLSYLVTGRPSLDVGSRTAAASVLLPTVGSWFGTQLAGASGGIVDYVQIQTAELGDRTYGQLWDQPKSVFEGTSLGVGRQLGNRTFVSASAGLCKIAYNEIGTFDEVVGFKVEHRFNHGFSLEVGSEPASSALLCERGGRLRGVVDTPRQFGFDLFRAWTF
jgi:translocation and assembly module TamB